jgi:2-methylaconitate cis-trans-isomerase PrpF
MPSLRVPCVLMRGGTSRGPFFLARDLPGTTEERDAFLLAAMGSGHELQVDGIGGGNPLTSKVAIVGPSSVDGADVDYLFAQVKVTEAVVDTSPNCGNMLAGVGPFAIEAGLVRAEVGTTLVRIHNINTGKLIEARVATPDGRVSYDDDVAIDGVPGTAAAVELAFLNVAGSKTGKLLPTGAALDNIQGVNVTCIDAAMPLAIVRASDLGKSGHERPNEFDKDPEFLRRLEALRIAAGVRMGLRNVASLVIPKPVLVSEPVRGRAICARYFVPHSCHKALAVTGAVGLATACVTVGTVAQRLVGGLTLPATVRIEHPSGALDVRLEIQDCEKEPVARLIRTARRLFDGFVYAPIPSPRGECMARSRQSIAA